MKNYVSSQLGRKGQEFRVAAKNGWLEQTQLMNYDEMIVITRRVPKITKKKIGG